LRSVKYWIICLVSLLAYGTPPLERDGVVFAEGIASSVFTSPCAVIEQLAGTEHLRQFKRINGVFVADRKGEAWVSLRGFGLPHVYIPDLRYDSVSHFEKPFKGVRLKSKSVSVTAYTIAYHTQEELQRVAQPWVISKYKGKPLMYFLRKSLGVDHGSLVCEPAQVERTVRMFMSSVIIPLNGGATDVYLLEESSALMLVSESRQSIRILYQTPKVIDSLDEVMIDAPIDVINDLVNHLTAKPKSGNSDHGLAE
jgi:hypothetical protein